MRTPEDKIKEAVERYLAGEPAAGLAKEYLVSRPGFYLWIKKYKEARINEAMRSNMTAPNIEKAEKRDLSIENRALKREIAKWKKEYCDLLISR